MVFPPNVGPKAPERNPLIEPGYFKPSKFTISALSLGLTTLVTTSVNHNYVIGQQIRLLIPPYYGSFQLDERDGFVMSIPNPNQVVVNINSVGANAFIANPIYGPTPPQIVAMGDVNSGPINANGPTMSTLIPGSFQNISPI